MRTWGPAVAALAGILTMAAGIFLLTGDPSSDADPISATAEADGIYGPEPGPGDDATATPGAPPAAQPRPGETVAVPPVAVSFPAWELTTAVVPVGVLPSGALDLPDDPDTVGWWAAGALPGQDQGSVVLAGHIDSATAGAGALAVLLELDKGDLVAVTGTDGTTANYRVLERAATPKSQLDRGLFTRQGPHRLVLITCGGAFDEDTGRYADNIVVISAAVPA